MSVPGLPEIPEITRPVRVYFFDTDAGGVVHNVAYLRMIEVVRSDLAEHLGWSLAEMASGSGECPVVARTEIDYLRPARIGDSLLLTSRLVCIEKVRFHIESVLSRGEEVICRARQILVTVDLRTGRPRPLRGDWRERWPHLAK